MAELVGGALLSGFLNVLFERMASKEIVEFFQGKKAIPKLLKELKIMLMSANALLNDAEEKQLRDRNVKNWLEELKDLIYESDHVVDKINTEVLRCEIEEGSQSESMTTTKCLTCFPVWSSLFDRAVKEELENILPSLKFLLDQSDHLGLNKGVKRSSTVARSQAPLVEESDVYGRETEKKSLIELLLSDDDSLHKICVIPIVGMGGIGKTTIAEVVYKDARVEKHFDFKVWVTVSEEFDVHRLTKVIFEKITSRKCENEDTKAIQSELKKALRGKKFLFVHDDVWNENYELWDVLKSTFQSGAHGSKIIVTTRSDIVAKQMGNVKPYRLGVISEADCWELFTKHVFSNVDEHSDLKEMGIQFVKKCKGLPLAVKSIAGLLRSVMSQEAWSEILESNIWGMEFREVNNTNILPALWLSYSFLPPNLKRCFAFLSVFPKDYVFRDYEKIILMWMAEGLLQPQNNRRAEDVGKEYLNALISRSFFQGHSFLPVLIIHDLIHDLALFVSSGLRSSSSKTRYCSFKETSEGEFKQLDTTFLRTLIVESRLSESIVLRELALSRGGCLRALSLFGFSIKELPDSIGTLKHLRYLDFSWTNIEELPASLCSLYNLQTLLLTNCRQLRCLPRDLSRLIKLRHLDIKWVSLLKEMPPQMCNMKDLQALSSYIVGEKQSSKIQDLGELRLLQGSLWIRQLQNVISAEDALGANIKNKKYIGKIKFEWDTGITCEDPEKETEVLSALEPHSRIKEVEIKGFKGTKLPKWVGEESFRDIVRVSLIDCRNCRWLPPLGELASLKILIIEGMNEVVSVGDEFSGTTNPFPSLESLDIEKMSSWEKWSFSGSEPLFPRLKNLTIIECDKLKCGLPNCSLPALTTLFIKKTSSWEKWSFSGSEPLFPRLKYLTILECDKLKCGLPNRSLPALEILFLKKMSSWEKWLFSGSEPLFPRLNSLTIKGCDKLKCGLPNCSLPSLETIRIKQCNRMESVFPNETTPSSLILKSITIQRCETIEFFSSLPSTLTDPTVLDCRRLMLNRLSWGLHTLSALQELFLKGDIEDDSFPEEGLLPNGLQDLGISCCESLKGLNDKGFQNLTRLSQLRIIECKQLQCLPPQGFPQSLNKLCISRCPLLEKQCERESGHYWPNIQHIPEISIQGENISAFL